MLRFPLPSPARSQSRFDFDWQLAKRAEAKGARILAHTQAAKWEQGKIFLANGDTLPYTDLIVSAGRLFGQKAEPCYFGIKGHLKNIKIADRLEMYTFKSGYAGLSPIGEGKANFAAVIRTRKPLADPLKAIYQLSPQLEERLEGAELAFSDWMRSSLPGFGLKKRPLMDNTYFIGDAAGTIPPASGLGLSLALCSGYLAADYALKKDFIGFHKEWKKRYKRVFAIGHLLNFAFMHPSIAISAIKLGNLFPVWPQKFFKLTRFSHD